MIKGIKFSESITDVRVKKFLHTIGAEYYIDRDKDGYRFEFEYNTFTVSCDTRITFEQFVDEFAQTFYEAGRRDSIRRADSKMSELLCIEEEFVYVAWDKIKKGCKYSEDI